MILEISEHPDGVVTEPGNRIVYDLTENDAYAGAARVDGPGGRVGADRRSRAG